MHHPQPSWRSSKQTSRKKKKPLMKQSKRPTTKPVAAKKGLQDAYYSLPAIRDQVSGFREQIEQMERTMNTLCQVMAAVDQFNTPSSKQISREGGLLKSFQNIDFKQVMNLLQSPLVQALVETLAEEDPKKKK